MKQSRNDYREWPSSADNTLGLVDVHAPRCFSADYLNNQRERALKDFDILELLIVHRYGEITIGENIVLIIAGAEHRAEAFRACKWAIDELKQITPIWKLEHTPSGEVWVEEHP